MRLICPNCDAQYEVDASAVSPAGRDVQCSNCGHAWFQMPEAEDLADSVPEDARPADTAARPAPPLPPRRVIDESILAVLREEAEREAIARRADAATLEMQGDLGLAPPARQPSRPPVAPPQPAPQDRAPDPAPAAPQAEGVPAPARAPDPPQPRPAARRDLLPDIEEINSSLSPSLSTTRNSREVDELPDLTLGRGKQKSGFRSGFVLMLLLAGIGIALYVMAPQISQQIPGVADALNTYVAAVDAARVWLDGLIRRATGVLNGFTASIGV